MTPFDLVVSKLRSGGWDPREHGPGHCRSRCPVQKGGSHNLMVDEADDGKVLLCCQHQDAGGSTCSVGSIVAELGLTMADLMPRTGRSAAGAGKKSENGAVYLSAEKAAAAAAYYARGKVSQAGPWIYANADGVEVFRVYRLDLAGGGREFRPVYEGEDGWHIGNPMKRGRPLYRLGEIAAAEMVVLLEGEKCADFARGMGLVATTSSHGAGAAKRTDWGPLAGKLVVLVPDHDEAGERYVNEVGRILSDLPSPPFIRVLRLPLENAGADLEEWIASLLSEMGSGERRAELLKLIGAAEAWKPPAAKAKAAPKSPPAGPGSDDDKETHADTLLRLAGVATLFHDKGGRPYAAVPANGHVEVHPIGSTGFRRWLKRQFFEEMGRPPSAEAFQAALGVLDCRAIYDGREEPVFIRVAGHGDRIYVDMGDPAWRAIEIDAEDWRIVAGPPVRFRRSAGMRPLPEPAPGASIGDLAGLVNVEPEDLPFLIAWLAAALRPSGPYAILALIGEAGAAKSTAARILRTLVDPHVMPLRSEPKEDRDLMVGASGNWVMAFDNLSAVSPWLSDALCRLASGGGFATRTLYTDDEETLLSATRPAILTGITEFVNRDDLTDRSLFLRLCRIPDAKRKTEEDLDAEIDAALPCLLGSLLDAVSGGLARLPEVKASVGSLPRMGDFALFGEAVSRGLGEPDGAFLEAYELNRREANESIVEDSPVAGAIRILIDRSEDHAWTGTAGELLGAVRKILEPPESTANGYVAKATGRRRKDVLPKTPRGMSGVIRRLAPSLRMVGIEVRSGFIRK